MLSVVMPRHFAGKISTMPDTRPDERSVKEGYIRSIGIQFGNVIETCRSDPVFTKAYSLAEGRSSVSLHKLVNLYITIRYFLPRLPFGHIAEFGTHRGGSALFMAVAAAHFLPGVKVFGFDTFEGMPQTSTLDAHGEGDFQGADPREIQDCAERNGIGNLVLIKGTFEEALPPALGDIAPLNLLHIDCDIHSGVVAAYDGAKGVVNPGGYIVLDDPLISTCLGAFTAAEDILIRRDGLSAEQVFPHLVFRHPRRNAG